MNIRAILTTPRDKISPDLNSPTSFTYIKSYKMSLFIIKLSIHHMTTPEITTCAVKSTPRDQLCPDLNSSTLIPYI